MDTESLLPWIVSIGLLSVRLTMAVALSPALTAYGVPALVHVALTLALATLTFAYRTPAPAVTQWVADPAQLLVPVLVEVFIGALLGLGLHVVLAALALAGQLMDIQAGFGIGSVFDPVTQASTNVLGSLTALLGVALFLTTDAHLQLAQLVGESIDAFPLGQLPSLDEPMRPLFAAGSMFTLGLTFAGPVAVALLLTDLAIGVVSRNMPQINVLVLALPVKVMVAYVVLTMAVTTWGPLMQQGISAMFRLLGTR